MEMVLSHLPRYCKSNIQHNANAIYAHLYQNNFRISSKYSTPFCSRNRKISWRIKLTGFKTFQVIWKLLPYSFMWRTDYILDAIKCTSISKRFCGIRSLWIKSKRCTMVSLFCSFGLGWFLILLNLFLLSLISTSLPLMAPGHHKDDQVQQGNITIHAFTDTFLGTRCVSFHHYFSSIMTFNSLIHSTQSTYPLFKPL